MASLQNGHVNGHVPGLPGGLAHASIRFSDVPPVLDVVVQGLGTEEAVEIDLEGLPDDPTELCTLLENEGAGKASWMTIALAYAKESKIDHAIEVLTKALAAVSQEPPKAKVSMLSCLCWLDLWKSREAPRLAPGTSHGS